MKILFYVLSVISFISMCFVFYSMEDNIIQEIDALLWAILGVISLFGGAVIGRMDELIEKSNKK